MSKVFIGTSGWTYDGWRGRFYPRDVAKKDWLSWYGTQFLSTEINGSFYRTPSLKAVRGWRDDTPKDFLFAWKASKFITHWKRLSEKSDNSIASFLTMLPRCYPYAFEFRHESWYEDDILDLLRDHDVSLCLSDHHDAPSPWEVTARHVYVRGHGPGGRYKDHYPDKTLRQWARDIRTWKRQRRTVFVYFDNDQKSAAPKDAKRLMEMLKS